MTPREFLEANDLEAVENVARKAGTNLANFKQIALWGGACSHRLADRLEKASNGQMTLREILFRPEHETGKGDKAVSAAG